MANNRREMINKYGFSGLSRSQEFGTGANHVERDGYLHDAIRAAGGDPAKYTGSNWDEESIRTVEAERRHQLMSDKDY